MSFRTSQHIPSRDVVRIACAGTHTPDMDLAFDTESPVLTVSPWESLQPAVFFPRRDLDKLLNDPSNSCLLPMKVEKMFAVCFLSSEVETFHILFCKETP